MKSSAAEACWGGTGFWPCTQRLLAPTRFSQHVSSGTAAASQVATANRNTVTDMRICSTAVVILVVLLGFPSVAIPWIVPQPKANVWKTLAQSLGQDHICLASTAAQDPMAACLVGIPVKREEMPVSLLRLKSVFAGNSLSDWEEWSKSLPQAPQEPQELDLLGSAQAHDCVHFDFTPHETQIKSFYQLRQIKSSYIAKNWCSRIVHVTTPSSDVSHPLPRSLPKGFFLICGDRAFTGIPARLIGGPCTLGKLSLFTPNMTQVLDWHKKNSSNHALIQKRELASLDPDCKSEIIHWSRAKATALTGFLPWVSIAKSMGELGRLECWAAKQANLTTQAISDLLSDEQVTRQATLQNRAAIDYMLLLHQHSWEEFEGLCCFNLSSKAEDVKDSIQRLRGMVNSIKKETGDWFDNLVQGFGLSNLSSFWIKVSFLILFVILIVAIACSIVKALLMKIIFPSAPPSVHSVHFQEPDIEYESDSDSCSEHSSEIDSSEIDSFEIDISEH